MPSKEDAVAALAAFTAKLEGEGTSLDDVVSALLEVIESRLLFGSAVLEPETLKTLQERLASLVEDIAPVVEEDGGGAQALDALSFGSPAGREALVRSAETPVERRDVTALRAHPRFVTRQRVELAASGREELRAYWTTDISRGGLFVETDDGPPVGTELDIALKTRDGLLELKGVVVRAVAGGAGPAGVGVQFTDLDAAKRADLEAYVEGISRELTGGYLRPQRTDDERLLAAKSFLASAGSGQYYEALGLDDSASEAEISERLASLGALFDPGAAADETARVKLETAARVLRRVESVLGDETFRISHDLTSGKHTINELRKRYDREKLHAAWRSTFPARVERAQARVLEAVRAADARRFMDAAKLAEEAAEDDPFDVELMLRAGRWRVLDSLMKEMQSGSVDVERAMPMLQAAGIGVANVRALWRELYPEKLGQSSAFGREAVEALEAGDVEAALKAARRALRLDPFNQRVRNVVAACERVLR